MFCIRRTSSAIKQRKNDFVIKSITWVWLRRCSFHCLPRDGGKTLIPGWCSGLALSVSKLPVGVIIAAWNRQWWEVIRSHTVLSSRTTLMRLSWANIGKIKRRKTWQEVSFSYSFEILSNLFFKVPPNIQLRPHDIDVLFLEWLQTRSGILTFCHNSYQNKSISQSTPCINVRWSLALLI